MPNYSYHCENCDKKFELFAYIKDYNPKPNCVYCKSKNVSRLYCLDVLSQAASVKKSDSELKTIGDLARRNSDRMSDDEKISLYHKHNDYKEQDSNKELPSGMSRIKKPPKTFWPGSTGIKKKRKPKK